MFVYFAVVTQQLQQQIELVPFYFPMGSFFRSSDAFSSCLSFVFHIVPCPWQLMASVSVLFLLCGMNLGVLV